MSFKEPSDNPDSMQRLIPPPSAYVRHCCGVPPSAQLRPAPAAGTTTATMVSNISCVNSPGRNSSPTTTSNTEEEHADIPASPLAISQPVLALTTTARPGAVVLQPSRPASSASACFLCMKARTPCLGGIPCDRCRKLGVPHMCITTESIYSRASARLSLQAGRSNTQLQEQSNPEVVSVKQEEESPSDAELEKSVVPASASSLRVGSQVDPVYVMRELAAMKREQKKLLDDMQQLRIQNEKLEKSLEKAKMEVSNSKRLSLESHQQQQQLFDQDRFEVNGSEYGEMAMRATEDDNGVDDLPANSRDPGRSRRALARARTQYNNVNGVQPLLQVGQYEMLEQQRESHVSPPENKRRNSGSVSVQQANTQSVSFPRQHTQRSTRRKQHFEGGLAVVIYDLLVDPPVISEVTPSMANLLGTDSADLVNLPWFELVPESMRQQTIAAMNKIIQTGTPIQIPGLYQNSSGAFIQTTDTHTIVPDTSGSPHFDVVNIVPFVQQQKQAQRRHHTNRRTTKSTTARPSLQSAEYAIPPPSFPSATVSAPPEMILSRQQQQLPDYQDSSFLPAQETSKGVNPNQQVEIMDGQQQQEIPEFDQTNSGSNYGASVDNAGAQSDLQLDGSEQTPNGISPANGMQFYDPMFLSSSSSNNGPETSSTTYYGYM